MTRLPTSSTRTDTLFPATTLFRSPTTYRATSARRCKTVNDRLKTRLVDILIRFVALLDRLAGPAPAFRRLPANGPRSVLPAKIFWRAVAPRFRPDGCWSGQAENCGGGGGPIGGRGAARRRGVPAAA